MKTNKLTRQVREKKEQRERTEQKKKENFYWTRTLNAVSTRRTKDKKKLKLCSVLPGMIEMSLSTIISGCKSETLACSRIDPAALAFMPFMTGDVQGCGCV